MLEDFKHCKKTVGVKQSTKAVENGAAARVIIAKDCEQRVVRGIIELCEKTSVPITYADSMKQLGKACGIEVEAAVACILK
ncbi:ribosomal L7Ae/L30e/S12e/Gadd45 family protein [Ruminiclostridium cellobioparum]|uniref:Ribosomal protein HS6-type (S12/L30/L7a) n=1 Tax=Ruminiclostridium cellobioparum subsp. termitidis CT1112 TaxID=1195236 RepID=S0FY84_RUMCE|nr:ribosomal L7Ae/L30e/S12e/Gadd45 family protein [Ruminiclostridium cellobioparum]EMS74084.1 Ribosomal protein HS6-type (S12/L30/L7a) [Ruminiclostridium cellobioparum subsp. termitidis CT1112]